MSAPVPARNILALNSGSSSLKFGLYRIDSTNVELIFSGGAEAVDGNAGIFRLQDAKGTILVNETMPGFTQRQAVIRIKEYWTQRNLLPPSAVGHRIVHGGPELRNHCLIDQKTLEQLEAACAFAPLHGPVALSIVHQAQESFSGVPQAACFDTSFHSDMPDAARWLPIPKNLRSEGLQRYGFHGLSCESIVRQLSDHPPERLIIAHLGNGASVTAVRSGKTIDTSMGLTPTGGVIMSTRSGDLDPGILLYLLREKHYDATALEELLDRKSGLLGISDVSGDIRILHELAPSNPDARLAIEIFCLSVRKAIAAMIAVLGGADMIVFTGGIGENDASIRAAICDGLTWIGVSLDPTQNRVAQNPIHDAGSRCQIRVLASEEGEQIAHHTMTLINAQNAKFRP